MGVRRYELNEAQWSRIFTTKGDAVRQLLAEGFEAHIVRFASFNL